MYEILNIYLISMILYWSDEESTSFHLLKQYYPCAPIKVDSRIIAASTLLRILSKHKLIDRIWVEIKDRICEFTVMEIHRGEREKERKRKKELCSFVTLARPISCSSSRRQRILRQGFRESWLPPCFLPYWPLLSGLPRRAALGSLVAMRG